MPTNVIDAQIDVFEPNGNSTVDLAHHWPLYEERNSTFQDFIGGGNATVVGATLADTTFDGFPAPTFDGVNDYAYIGDGLVMDNQVSDLTVGVWFKTSVNQDQTLISFDDLKYFELGLKDDGRAYFTTTGQDGTTDTLFTSTDVIDGQWHFIAGSYDTNASPQKALVLDGQTERSSTPHPNNHIGTGVTRYGFFGINAAASTEDGTKGLNYFSGQMSDVFMYDRKLSAAELNDIYQTGLEAAVPDFRVPSADIDRIDITQRIEERKDTGRIEIFNDAGTYSQNGPKPIQSGDRLRIRTRLEGESGFTHRWSARARQVVYDEPRYGKSRITIKCEDFAFGIVSDMILEENFEGALLTGSESIFETLMAGVSDRLQVDGAQIASDTTDMVFRGTNGLEGLTELLKRGSLIAQTKDRGIKLLDPNNSTPKFTVTGDDHSHRIIRYDDSGLVNSVRVDGGRSFAKGDENSNAVSSYETATPASRVQFQVATRKSEIDRIKVWTRTTGSKEGLIFRIQADNGGAPAEPADGESDIVRQRITAENLTDDGLTEVIFKDHTLVGSNPWVLIESTGNDGQEVGVDAGGAPIFESYFPFELLTVQEDPTSILQYHRRQMRVTKDTIRTREQASGIAEDMVTHNKDPDVYIEMNAESIRMHTLNTGDVLTVNEDNASGTFVVTDKREQYDGLTLDTTITAQEVSTV